MNRAEHMLVGGVSSAFVFVAVKKALKEEVKIGEVLIFGGAGAVVATLPDVLEPATSPNHRGFFHSASLLCIIGYLLYRYWVAKDLKNGDVSAAISAVATAYCSHLIMDGTTPKGLPLINASI